MKQNRIIGVFLLLAGVIFGAGGMYAGMEVNEGVEYGQQYAEQNEEETPKAFQPDRSSEQDEGQFEKIEHVFSIIQSQYVEEVDEDKLIEGAITGMVDELEDPHSSYMDEETSAQFSEQLESTFEGIGAEVSMQNDRVTIVSPFRDSPAEKAGLQPNDQVLEVDGKSTEDLSLEEAVMEIRGEKGTTVTLTVSRPGVSDPFEVDVERDEIPVETVRTDTYEIDGALIGRLAITSFSENTADEFSEQLKALEDKGIDGLIIDVRNNPGGFLDSVEDIGNEVIPGNAPVVQIEDRNGERVRSLSSLDERKDYPIVGLINKASVSASEILAAALKEGGDYDLVGETTYGKGTVQQPIGLGDGSELKLSVYKWLTSDGNWINEKGVEPTIEVKQPDYFYLPVLDISETLTKGDAGEQISYVQEMLEALGYDPGEINGYFGDDTERAIRQLQEAHGLEVTGELNEETVQLINQNMLEQIQDPANDKQLNTALDVIVEQIQ